MLNDKPIALQLRYLQTLSGIAAEHHSTIIFPLPIDMTTNFLMSGSQIPMNNVLRNIPNGAQNLTTATVTATTNTTTFSDLYNNNNTNDSSELNV